MQFTLSELTFIGTKYPTVSDLSFFTFVKKGLTGTEEKSLEEKGVFSNGQLTEPMNTVFDVLAHANQSARFVLKYQNNVMEKGVYSFNDKRILVENMQGEIVISIYDDEAKSVQQEIADHIGMSVQKNSVLDTILETDELLVALSLADWLRKQTLLNYIEVNEMPTLTVELFERYLLIPMKNSIAGLLAGLYEIKMPDHEQKLKALNVLVEKKLIGIEGDAISFSKEFSNFAMNFLLPDTQIILETLDGSHEGPVVAASNVILQAGLKDIVAFNATDEGIEMNTLTSSELLARISAYLKCPKLK